MTSEEIKNELVKRGWNKKRGYQCVYLKGASKDYPNFINITTKKFYCQSKIEGRFTCNNQCEHCKEYYKPLEI